MKFAVRLAVPHSNAIRMSSTIRKVVLTTLALTSLPLFCSAQNPLNGTWKVDLKQVDFAPGSGKVKKLDLGPNQRNTFAGAANDKFVVAAPFRFLGLQSH